MLIFSIRIQKTLLMDIKFNKYQKIKIESDTFLVYWIFGNGNSIIFH